MCPIYDGQRVEAATDNAVFLDKTIDDTMQGKLTLANTDAQSGQPINNVQKTINELIQDSKVFISSGLITFDASLNAIVFNDNIEIHFKDNGKKNTILPATIPVLSGETAYVVVNRNLNTTLSVIVTNADIPKNIDTIRLFSRVGDLVYFYDNTALKKGESCYIGEGRVQVATTTEKGVVKLGTIASAIGGTSSPGTANGVVANADHTHEGVHSIGIVGDTTKLVGDVDLEAGNNVTLTRIANKIKIEANVTSSSSSGGGGGIEQLSTSCDGKIKLMLTPCAQNFVLQSPNTTKWYVRVDDFGAIYTTSGATEQQTPAFKIKSPNGTEYSIKIDDFGVLYTDTPSGQLNENFYLKSNSGYFYKLGVTDYGAITTTSDLKQNSFVLEDELTNPVFAFQQMQNGSVFYIKKFNKSNLPSSIPTYSGCYGLTFVDDNGIIRLAYYDGSIWRYVFSNNPV